MKLSRSSLFSLLSCPLTLLAGLGMPLGSAAPPPGDIVFTVIEHGGTKRIPARIHLRGPNGKPVIASGVPAWNDHFNCGGNVTVGAPPGRCHYTVERGPEYERAHGSVVVRAGGTHPVAVKLKRRHRLRALGWWSGDLHVHRSLSEVPFLMRSEDLHFAPVLTVWNKKNLWRSRPLPEKREVAVAGGRVYQLLACEDERRGGALLYFNLTTPLDLSADTPEYPPSVTHLREAVQQPDVWIDIEKPFWWDVPVWLATGEVDSIGLANNHMCRSTMYESEAWGRPRNARELPPPRGNGFYTQALYYRILDCGFRIPPSAGSASGVLPNPIGYNRVYVKVDGEFSPKAWWKSLRAGRCFVTNGPILSVRAAGQLPGHIFSAGKDATIPLEIEVGGNDPLEAVEVIVNGKVHSRLAKPRRGSKLEVAPVPARSGWFLVRAIAAVSETFRFASTGPFYVEAQDKIRRVHRPDVQFFLGWIDARMRQIRRRAAGDIGDQSIPENARRRDAALDAQRDARTYFEKLLKKAVD